MYVILHVSYCFFSININDKSMFSLRTKIIKTILLFLFTDLDLFYLKTKIDYSLRNWGYQWNTGGSSNNPCSDTYMGKLQRE